MSYARGRTLATWGQLFGGITLDSVDNQFGSFLSGGIGGAPGATFSFSVPSQNYSFRVDPDALMSQILGTSDKDTNESITYEMDWTRFVDFRGETMSASTWIVPAGLTIVSTPTPTTKKATIRLSGGTAGTTYQVDHRATLSGGDVFERSILIAVRT